MSALPVQVSPEWLDLRERADAAARSIELVDRLVPHLRPADRLVVHDLGGGTGAMGRWLAPLLPGPQHWVVHDRDAGLLELAVVAAAGVTVERRRSDVTRLALEELKGADLIVASALLDILTAAELLRMLAVCSAARCPLLFALTVVGRVVLVPADPVDSRIAAAFNAHQRRATVRGRLLGPDAAAIALEALHGMGREVVVRATPWRLDAADADLIAEWLDGWIAAACEQEPELAAQVGAYRHRRLEQAAAGELEVVVEHADLLVLP